MVVCVSPLTALMLDQRGLATELVGEAQADLQQIEEGLVYVSPEAFTCLPVVAFVVDGAHCVKKW